MPRPLVAYTCRNRDARAREATMAVALFAAEATLRALNVRMYV